MSAKKNIYDAFTAIRVDIKEAGLCSNPSLRLVQDSLNL